EEIAAGRGYYNFRYIEPGLQDLSGDSVFIKDDTGEIFHTYSTYGRGGEQFLGAYNYLDVTPEGRNGNGPFRSLTDWGRANTMYDQGGRVEGNGRYHRPSCECAAHHAAATGSAGT